MLMFSVTLAVIATVMIIAQQKSAMERLQRARIRERQDQNSLSRR